MASVKVDIQGGTVTIDRLFVLHIPDTADRIDSFMDWFQQQPEVTPRHTALMLGTLQRTIAFSNQFWQTVLEGGRQ